MVAFSVSKERKDDGDELTDIELSEVHELISTVGKMKRAKDTFSVVFMIENVSDAIRLRLSYTGKLEVKVFNVTDLTEIIK